MTEYQMREVWIEIEDKIVARVPEANVLISPSRIEVNIPDVSLSGQTMEILKLGTEEKLRELRIGGKVNNETLVIERALINRLTVASKKGEVVMLKNINILGLRAKWIYSE